MGIGSSQAKAEYGVGDKTVNVEIADMGAMGRLALAAGGVVQGERETADSVEKTWSENGRVLHHRYRKDASYSEFKATLKNGVVVSVEGNGVGIQDLRGIAGQIDLQALESLERPKKS
ncbi:hypothetical protein PY257_06575 [Ramlibacter sp. H39-3-26]|uniref:hypothetical protein n=1 Tax=Curvibacter soli TaxID=3031331 RepID=UPI0023DA00B2|nr:hypothetical protein [Ramlibacter sp. H39-3-26]MDF1484853.1 hypothetical protein [Ramlibacter sp. H39-3-26]